MIQREYLTEYDEYSHGIRHSITISTDDYYVFKTIKAYVESVCENEDAPARCERGDNNDKEVREALMRLSMCAREDCVICKYKDKCNFDFQYEESTKNMNTILDSLMRSKCEVDAND